MALLVKRTWMEKKRDKNKIHIPAQPVWFTAWYLFGIIPLFRVERTSWFEKELK